MGGTRMLPQARFQRLPRGPRSGGLLEWVGDGLFPAHIPCELSSTQRSLHAVSTLGAASCSQSPAARAQPGAAKGALRGQIAQSPPKTRTLLVGNNPLV